VVEARERRSARRHPPPTPSLILPVPRQLGQDSPLSLPVPLHSGQIFSPVPGVPTGPSSPGFRGGASLWRLLGMDIRFSSERAVPVVVPGTHSARRRSQTMRKVFTSR
jgi:hypothetical protein